MNVWAVSPLCCLMCGESACYEEFPICTDCLPLVQEAITDRCANCNKTASACVCSLNNSRFAFYYDSPFARRIIRSIKTMPDLTVTDFLCELAVNCCGIPIETFDGVAFVPRYKPNSNRFGFDQAEVLAMSISRNYGLKMLYAIERVGGREQKLLSRAERAKNIKDKYRLRRDFQIEESYGKVLLIDDIYTTGATISTCAELLRGKISKAVIPLTLSKTNYLMRS